MNVGLCLALTAATGFAAADISTSEDEPVEEWDAIEEVVPAESSASLGQTIGRLHSAMVHLPIGWLVLLGLLEVIGSRWRRSEIQRVTPLVLLATVASLVPAMASGFMQLSNMAPDSPRLALTLDHRNLMIASGLLALTATGVRLWRDTAMPRWRWTYRGLLISAIVTAAIGGHLGGKLVFGENYLPF